MKKTHMIVTFFGILFCLIIVSPSIAGVFDGSKTLYCSLMDTVECLPGGECQEFEAEDVNLPAFIVIDFGKKTIRMAKGVENKRTSTIENRELIDGKLILQGAEDGVEGLRDGLGWSIAINESTGKMVLTGSGDDVGFVVFGACTPQ
jgi:hypothetical protein